MNKVLISYELTIEGTIPKYVIDGGYYPNNIDTKMILLGVANSDMTFDESVLTFQNVDQLETYIASYTAGDRWMNKALHPYDEGLPFDPKLPPIICGRNCDRCTSRQYGKAIDPDRRSRNWLHRNF